MVDHKPVDRRTVLRAAGGIAIASVLAGCMSGGSTSGDKPKSIESWLSQTKNFNAVEDKTGSKSVTVAVGPKQNEYVFAPAAIKITPGTTVTWKWIGSESHNVVATDESFNSGGVESSGTFEHTFETAGTFYYYCDPHKSMGMKGVVVVEDSATSVQRSAYQLPREDR